MSSFQNDGTLNATSAGQVSALAALSAPVAVVLPNARLGAADSTVITVINSATVGSAELDVTGGASGHFTLSGSVVGLAPQTSDSTDLVLGLNTGFVGEQAGNVTLTPVSEPNTTLTSDTIPVFGAVYREAQAYVAPLDETVRVGDTGTAALQIINTVGDDGFSEALMAAVTSASGGLSVASTAFSPDILPGNVGTIAQAVSFSTATAGTITGTATLALVSDGGSGAASIDGLGTVAEAAITVPVNITVEGAAEATIEYDGQPVTGGTIDVGAIQTGRPFQIPSFGIEVLNSAIGPADLLSGSLTSSGGVAVFDTFSGLAAGALANFSGGFEAVGPFTGTVTLSAESTLPDGSDPIALPDQTVTVVGELLYVGCFLAGSQLATPSGPVAVEALSVGDRVRIADGGTRPVVWIGQRVVDCASHADPASVLPVRIKRGAFGRNLPARDLLLSPDHAVFAEGVLIPVRHLIDGVGIVQRPARRAHYFHIELDRHDIVLAEGLSVESYLDVGDRARFETIGAAPLVPAEHAARIWDSDGCAPLCVTGPALDRVRARLSRQARRHRPTANNAARPGRGNAEVSGRCP